MATATAQKKVAERRTAPAKNTPTTKPTVPAPPKLREKRVAAPATADNKLIAPVKPKATAPAKKTSEKRVDPPAKKERAEKPVVAAAPYAMKANDLSRMLSTVTLLDEYGPEIVPEVIRITKPHFKGVIKPAACELVILVKPVLRRIKGTGNPALDGKTFNFKVGDLAVIQTDEKTGVITMFNTDTDVPCAAQFVDGKAKASLNYIVVPTTEDELDKLVETEGKKLEALGMKVEWV